MAAGEGKRMNSNIPKVLHLFKNKPMLVRIITEALKLNPHKIIVITGKFHNLIQETINKYLENDNIIEYVQQTNPMGTGDAIKCTLHLYNENENVLILNGDMPLITSKLLKNFINYKEDININKIIVAKLDKPYGYGRILYDTNNNFFGIKEEKDCDINEKLINIINVGIYYFNSSILKQYIPLIDNNNKQNEYYLTDIIKVINNNISIYTYCIEEEFKFQIMGVNTQEELFELEKTI